MAKKILTSYDMTGNSITNIGNIYTKTEIDTNTVPKTRTINTKPLSADITLSTADIADSTDKRYCTDAQKTSITANTGDETTATIKTKLGITTLSGSNTGDQTITLTGDITGTGTGSFATTIAAKAVTLTKLADLTANSIIGNNTGTAGVPIALSVAQIKTLLGIVSTKFASNIGNGTLTSIPVTHTLGTLDVNVNVYEISTGIRVGTDITLTDTNTVTIGFTIAPTANQYRVVVTS